MDRKIKRALICGVSGQDGAYLARLLLNKGYAVYGSSRDAQMSSFRNLARLGILDKINLESVAVNDFRSVLQALMKIQPDEVYNLAGQSSVGLSFQQPVETLESISVGTLNFLEAIRFAGRPTRFYNAGSSECFGDINDVADESTPFAPRSPYAVAKAAAFWEVANYREAYGLFACSGILFNHESPLRGTEFVTRKITDSVARIALGKLDTLLLGNLDAKRDWGFAGDYVQAMWLMLQQDRPDDYVVATGENHSVQELTELAFARVGLDWRECVVIDPMLKRPAEVDVLLGDATKARTVLGWSPKVRFPELVQMMVEADLARCRALAGA
jgi:GDPmannose 4,6-dehydratase